ncbi:MAG: hypothetical protein LQ338_002802 [Usnochroma carphineum]|nr:MAG: hypothetical protein LQ338_002802 [Usnochroma carphineum]
MALPSTTASTSSSASVIKRSYSEMGSDNEDMGVIPLSFRRFASRVVDVYVGDERFHYAAHEAFLFQSKELKIQYDSQNKGKKGNKKKENVLNLPRDTVNEFGQLLEYLYLNKLTLRALEPQAQADELLTVWTAGSRHSLLGMQTHVIRKLEELDLASKLPALSFLRLADHLYESEVDNGLRRYFESVAGDVVRKITATDMPVLLEMITEGGSFASDLFHAYHQAFGPSKSRPATEQGNTANMVKVEDSEQQRTAKRARTDDGDVRTEWDRANNIPEALETASTEDKLLVTWVEDHKPWGEIADAWENATGARVSVVDLVHRYKRIDANVLRLGTRDSELLMAAKSAIEAKFNQEKWPLIAAKIVDGGGSKIEPLRLQRYCDALDAAKVKAIGQEGEAHLHVQAVRPNSHKSASDNCQLPTEIVGGVRVENSKPLDVRRRRRGPVKVSTAAKAGKPFAAKSKTTSDVLDNSDIDTENGEREPTTREPSSLFVGEGEDFGPVDTGVRVSNDRRIPRGSSFGNMRHDGFMDVDGGVHVANEARATGTTVVNDVIEDDAIVGNIEDLDDVEDDAGETNL